MKFIKYWLPVGIYAIFIFYISSLPGKDLPQLFRYQDVVFHILEYVVFGLLLNRAVKASYTHLTPQARSFLVFLICILYAASDEFHQSFVPNRYPSFSDLLSDGIGIFVANILYR